MKKSLLPGSLVVGLLVCRNAARVAAEVAKTHVLRSWMLLLLSIVLTGFSWSIPAAADVFTPGVFTGPNEGIVCSIVNVGSRTLSVTIEVVDDQAEVLSDKNAPLAPGEATSFFWIATHGFQRCAFRGNFSGRVVRANASMLDLTTSTIVLSMPAY